MFKLPDNLIGDKEYWKDKFDELVLGKSEINELVIRTFDEIKNNILSSHKPFINNCEILLSARQMNRLADKILEFIDVKTQFAEHLQNKHKNLPLDRIVELFRYPGLKDIVIALRNYFTKKRLKLQKIKIVLRNEIKHE